MYSPHIASERSYSCLLQLSNIMLLRTVPFAPSVQYPLPKTCIYESERPTSRESYTVSSLTFWHFQISDSAVNYVSFIFSEYKNTDGVNARDKFCSTYQFFLVFQGLV